MQHVYSVELNRIPSSPHFNCTCVCATTGLVWVCVWYMYMLHLLPIGSSSPIWTRTWCCLSRSTVIRSCFRCKYIWKRRTCAFVYDRLASCGDVTRLCYIMFIRVFDGMLRRAVYMCIHIVFMFSFAHEYEYHVVFVFVVVYSCLLASCGGERSSFTSRTWTIDTWKRSSEKSGCSNSCQKFYEWITECGKQ